MDKERWSGQMEIVIKEIGKKAKLMGKESISMIVEIFTKVIIKMEK